MSTNTFFPTYRDNWTRTPNVFFDEVLTSKGVTANEIKLVGHLIRHTLGYNKEAKWIGASRNDLIKKANIPNGCITETISKCTSKGWILEYAVNKQRFLFLNDERNQLIVEGLKDGAFKVNDILYLNEAGLSILLNDYLSNKNTHSSTDPVVQNTHSSTESVVPPYGSRSTYYTDSVEEQTFPEASKTQKRSGSKRLQNGFERPLNTIYKDNKYKDKKSPFSDLPKSVQKQMNGEWKVDMSAEDLMEKQRRIQEKLTKMNAAFEQSQAEK